MTKLKLQDIVTKLEFKVECCEEKTTNEIKTYGLNRAGLELAGYFDKGSKAKRLILLSTKESSFISNFPIKERKERYRKLMEAEVPGIVLTQKFKDDCILEIAKEMNVPIVRTHKETTSVIVQEILETMDFYFAPSDEVHGTLINIFGKGVLLMGESGIGKSELALDLIEKNHLFVGDDRIIVKRKSNEIIGSCHSILQNLIEVRGIGIIDVSKTHGHQVIMDKTSVDLILELQKFKKDGVDDSDRLGREFEHKKMLGINIPYIKLPVSSGRNIANIIETAVAKLKLSNSKDYQNPAILFEKRIKEYND